MNELLMKRIERRLGNLSDQQGYQVLDYVEFLETKYGTGEGKSSVIDRIAEGVEDTMRAGRIPAAAIRGTMSAMDTASQVMERLAHAGRSAVEELGKTVATPAGDTAVAPTDDVDGEATPVAESAADPPEAAPAADEDDEEPTGSG